jgi:hypothetical protein
MYKVVYNDCYGGFSLSREAVLLARELSGDPDWGGVCIKGDYWVKDDKKILWDYDYGHCDVPRHDPILIKVVEQLGTKRASGGCSELKIEEIFTNTYRIDEYDGLETVMVSDSYGWTVIED